MASRNVANHDHRAVMVRLLSVGQSGKRTKVDADVYAWAKDYSWYIGSWGYVCRSGDNRSLHRLILDLVPSDPREGDHKNRNKLDNRRSNLRILSRGHNKQNTQARKTMKGKPPKSK